MLQALSKKRNSFLRPLKKKGFNNKSVTIMGLYDIGKSHDPGIQQEPRLISAREASRVERSSYADEPRGRDVGGV